MKSLHIDTLTDTRLLNLVISGDVDQVRCYLDKSIEGHEIVHPTWAHLKIALEQKNRSMSKLLVTWGAQPTRQELAELITQNEHSLEDIQFLKLAGVNVTNIDLGFAAPAFNAHAKITVPQNEQLCTPTIPALGGFKAPPFGWFMMLLALEKAGASEAVIAGGALLDLQNGKPVSSVDIFIKAPFRKKKFLQKTVAFLPYRACPQLSDGAQSWHDTVDFVRIRKRLGARDPDRYYIGDPLDRTETWQIIVQDISLISKGPGQPPELIKTPVTFNIIMLSGELGAGLRSGYKNGTDVGVHSLLDRFDFGLCQIACTLRRMIVTDAYARDVNFKTLTLKDPMNTTMDRVRAMTTKYPDHTPNDKLAEVVRTGRLPPRTLPPPTMMFTHGHM